MKFRLKAFCLHLLGSACVLTLVWGGLYLGWYRWPGWYLTGVLQIGGIMAAVDLVLGPSLTLIIANPGKPRRELARDVSIIVFVQIVALVYGSVTLWHGRPIYYTYSEKWLEMVQASDINFTETDLARKQNPQFAPHWYSLPRWVWAPLPQDEKLANEIFKNAIGGGADVTQMPRYFKPYSQAYSEMRTRLKVVDSFGEFSMREKQRLKERMQQRGFAVDQPIAMVMMGRTKPILAIFDPDRMQIRAWITAD
ncbi:MAG: hypothetical protein ACJ8R9_16875 [Steroidobacteraceae bacterium]